MRVAILKSAKAYLPETEAYRDYLVERGIAAKCVERRRDIAPEDLAILFRTRDRVSRKIAARRRIHEEHNLSGSPASRIKQVALALGPRPDGEIKLDHPGNPAESGRAPTLVRQTGVDPAILSARPSPDPDFDLVYCGTLTRPGLAAGLASLGRKGFRIAVYGDVPPDFPSADLARHGITFFGAIGRAEVPSALSNARAGLNITPDIFPLNVQDSMKTLEYVAMGLPVVANRYPWAERFVADHATQFLWTDRINSPDDLDDFAPTPVDLSKRAWPTMFDRIGLIDFLKKVDA